MPMKTPALVLAVFVAALSANAQVYVSPGGDNSTGASWATAFTSVSTGVTAANSQSEDLWIAEGTYAIGSTISVPSNLTIYGGFPNTGNPSLGQRDPSLYATILDANSTDHIFLCTNATGVVIDGVQFTEADGATTAGGAIRVISNSDIDINLCTFFNNGAMNYGGGVYVENAHADITNSRFDSNTANEAGALMLFNGTATVSDTTFVNNDGGGQGGAILTYQVAITLNKCVFDSNTASRGGAVAIREGTGGSITNSLFIGNSAGDHGGAINYESQLNASIANCTFVDNTAATRGGGVFWHSSGGSLINSIFMNNDKNAIYENDASADPLVKNNLFFSNPDGVYYDESSTSYGSGVNLNSGVAQATNNIDGNPNFINAGAGDYHLQAVSPARQAGTTTGAPMQDIDNEFRDGFPDIGFDERDPGVPLTVTALVALLLGAVGAGYLVRHRKALR
jgi:predicted outer membrane repeat protein